MKLSDNAMAVLLLCSYIGINKDVSIKPFTLGEWNLFLDRIREQNREPGMLLSQDLSFLKEMEYKAIDIDRIQKLVSRGGAAAFELDDLARKGIEVVTIFDSDYPMLLKRKLKKKTPPLFFYAGNIELAKKIGIAVVGSRNIDQAGIEFTRKLVQKAADERLIVYSGGAKGVDSISEKEAIQSGSAVVSFIADSLLDKIKKRDVLDSIMHGKMLLFSDVRPDAGFSAARAMNRNKYIYAASYGAFVIASDYNKGGTWTGAVEAMKNSWSKVMVWSQGDYDGNRRLIEKGGAPYRLSEENLYEIITKKKSEYVQLDFFKSSQPAFINEEMAEYRCCVTSEVPKEQELDLYEVIKEYITEHLDSGMSAEEAAQRFHVAKGQMAVWLKRLQADGLISCNKGIYKGQF